MWLSGIIHVNLHMHSPCAAFSIFAISWLTYINVKLWLNTNFVFCCRLSEKNPINADDELLELLS